MSVSFDPFPGNDIGAPSIQLPVRAVVFVCGMLGVLAGGMVMVWWRQALSPPVARDRQGRGRPARAGQRPGQGPQLAGKLGPCRAAATLPIAGVFRDDPVRGDATTPDGKPRRHDAKSPIVKICGLSTAPTLDAALAAGAGTWSAFFLGPSLRNVTPAPASPTGPARERPRQKWRSRWTPTTPRWTPFAALEPDILQPVAAGKRAGPHGRNPRPRQPADHEGAGVSTATTLRQSPSMPPIADWLLFDAKPPKEATRPGGKRFSFDWAISTPFDRETSMVAAGWLDRPPSAPRRLACTGAPGVDVSSGVESRTLNQQTPNSFRTGPDDHGRFGLFGGRFVAETLMPLILDLEKAYEAAKNDPAFHAEIAHLLPIMSAGRVRSISPNG